MVKAIVKQCYITNLPTYNVNDKGINTSIYGVKINNDRYIFRFDLNHKNSEFVESNKHIIHGLILNGMYPEEYDCKTHKDLILDNEILEKIIDQAAVPKSPREKLNSLLLYIQSKQRFEGALTIRVDSKNEELAKRLYLKSGGEMLFYFFTLYEQKLIDAIDLSDRDSGTLDEISLTFNGLERIIELSDSGRKSKNCFIAMSFSGELKETRKAIKSAITAVGYQPILIDEVHIESDVTINDAMIAEIRKCKFLVADFTQHKHGVYFESGFALGLNRPVIYMCHKDDFDNSHFDTKHYPHIIYEDLDDLKNKLKTKVEAWIQ